MKKTGMKATSIRQLLTLVLVLVIAAGVGGFYYGLQQVKAFAVDVSHTSEDANASGKNIEELQQLKQALAEREALVAKAEKVFATEENYQSQALTDVQRYASKYGLTLTNTDFEVDAPEGSLTTGSGHVFAITIQSPVAYDKLLQFLDAVEGNAPKMQIASLKLGRTTAGGANTVQVEDIKLTISTR